MINHQFVAKQIQSQQIKTQNLYENVSCLYSCVASILSLRDFTAQNYTKYNELEHVKLMINR